MPHQSSRVQFKALTCFLLVFFICLQSAQNSAKDFSQVASFESRIDPAVLEAEISSAPANTGISIDSAIFPAGNQALSSRSEVNSGESIQFSYAITNSSDVAYSFAALDTHIPRQLVHFIHDVTGATSLNDDQDSIIIPNIFLAPHQTQVISFKANVNYFTETDAFISTQAELILPGQDFSQKLESSQNVRLGTSQKKGILVKKIKIFQAGTQAQAGVLEDSK